MSGGGGGGGGGGVGDWRVEVRRPPSEAPAGTPCTIVVSSSSSSSSTPSEELAYPLQFVKGVGYPAWCSEQRWSRLQSLSLRPDDVLVVSYPKCGTTWAEQCILLLQTRCDVSKMDPASKNVYCPGRGHAGKIWPEGCVEQNPQVHLKAGLEFLPMTQAEFDAAPAPRTLKSHAPPHLLLTGKAPSEEAANSDPLTDLPAQTKLLVVTRNPLDACVSSYYHAWNPAKSGWPFAAWAAAWISGNVPHGCWFQWVKAWKRQSEMHPERVLWVQFEDLKRDPVGTVRRVAQWLSPELGADEALIRQVAEASSFDSMKEQAEGAGAGSVEAGGAGGKAAHLRKGVAGDWRNHFSPALQADFVERYRSEMAGSGIVFSLGEGEEDLA